MKNSLKCDIKYKVKITLKGAILYFQCCFICKTLIAQQKDSLRKHIIYWDSNRKLKWEDFQATPYDYFNASAVSSVGISYRYKYDNGKYNVIGSAVFSKKESFVFMERIDDGSLDHEQIHFDIAAIYSKKFQQRIDSANYTNQTVAKRTNQIFDSVVAELRAMQDLYDFETVHGTEPVKQLEWKLKVQRGLKFYNLDK